MTERMEELHQALIEFSEEAGVELFPVITAGGVGIEALLEDGRTTPLFSGGSAAKALEFFRGFSAGYAFADSLGAAESVTVPLEAFLDAFERAS